MLHRLLLGQERVTAEQLVSPQGSSGRLSDRPSTLSSGDPAELIIAKQAAQSIEVDVSYIQRLAAKTATYRSTHDASTAGMSSTDAPTGAFLDAVKVDSEWRIARGEVERLLAARHEPQVVIGYVVTCSTAKSLSSVWATGDAEVRALCGQAFKAGVAKPWSTWNPAPECRRLVDAAFLPITGSGMRPLVAPAQAKLIASRRFACTAYRNGPSSRSQASTIAGSDRTILSAMSVALRLALVSTMARTR